MKKIVRPVINIILIFILAYSSYNVYIKLKDYKQADKIYTELRESKENNEKDRKSKDLSHINEDFRFWITVENTNIDFPVVQGPDNDFYLYKDFYKNKLPSGSIFMDYRNRHEDDENIILYGHNMKNNTMFENLEKFKDKDFFNSNNKIKIDYKDKEYIYEVFSVYVTDPSYDYLIPRFNSDEEYQSYINTIKDKSLNKSKLDVTIKDKMITLSTCSYEFDNARTIVHGKLVSMN